MKKDVKEPQISHETKLTIVRFFAEHSTPKLIAKKRKEDSKNTKAV
ncbi:hypothetical protein [Salinibacillus xinjiangensis]|uniref:Uncharacterized protein n=1 Tax=Salinibacillus xinjiangensis TaxID=1229268 RepID=A0A6G1X7J4_9BACI|nr:hypothetical protein [Salinibacillus xinjiangensis]MRG86973.1 hypothetical protein [Salinibacillus xinjiangensis]